MTAKANLQKRLAATRLHIVDQISVFNQGVINLFDAIFFTTLQTIRLFPKYSVAILLGAMVGITRALLSPTGILGGIIAFNLAALGLLPAGFGLYAAFLAGNIIFSAVNSLAGMIDNYVSKRESIEKKCSLPAVLAIEEERYIDHATVKSILAAASKIDRSADTTLSSSIEAGMIVTNLVLNLHGMPRLYNVQDDAGVAKRAVAVARGD